MRCRVIIALLLLAGCATSDARAPQSAGEWREFEQHKKVVERVWSRVAAANADLCQDQSSRCKPSIHLYVASEKLAGSKNQAVHITFPLLRFFESDDERALVIAHEWAHNLLRHWEQIPDPLPFTKAMESEADCVGALIAARAGYDVRAGSTVFRRMGQTMGGMVHTVSLGTTHPTWGQRFDDLQRVAAAVDHRGGRSVSVLGIRQICGAAP